MTTITVVDGLGPCTRAAQHQSDAPIPASYHDVPARAGKKAIGCRPARRGQAEQTLVRCLTGSSSSLYDLSIQAHPEPAARGSSWPSCGTSSISAQTDKSGSKNSCRARCPWVKLHTKAAAAAEERVVGRTIRSVFPAKMTSHSLTWSAKA